nr:MAG TPA: hypothetical protein [Caudoviricetes sp.]
MRENLLRCFFPSTPHYLTISPYLKTHPDQHGVIFLCGILEQEKENAVGYARN